MLAMSPTEQKLSGQGFQLGKCSFKIKKKNSRGCWLHLKLYQQYMRFSAFDPKKGNLRNIFYFRQVRDQTRGLLSQVLDACKNTIRDGKYLQRRQRARLQIRSKSLRRHPYVNKAEVYPKNSTTISRDMFCARAEMAVNLVFRNAHLII